MKRQDINVKKLESLLPGFIVKKEHLEQDEIGVIQKGQTPKAGWYYFTLDGFNTEEELVKVIKSFFQTKKAQ